MNPPDKTIVDRRRPHRNSEVARAVRQTRDQLAQRGGNPVFDRELIKIHARSIVRGAGALPLLVLIVAIGGMLGGLQKETPLWALTSLAGYALLIVVARRIDATEIASIDAAAAKRLLLAAHFGTGLGWVYWVMMGCGTCAPLEFSVVKASVLLVAIAASALLGSTLRSALLVTFVLPVALFTVFVADFALVSDAAITVVLLLSLPLFTYMASQLSQSSTMLLTFRSENDGLIAELETARAISEEARHRAEDSNLAKSRFLATMSHELRTPLNAILGFSEVMAKEVLGPIQSEIYRDYARDIHESGRHLLELINEILDLSRIEAGKHQLAEEPLSLAAVVEESCHMMELKARQKDLKIVMEFEPTLARVFADERAVRQIALNLLSNAIKFSPTGGEILVRVGWTAGAGQYVSVRDHGPGIPPEEIPVVLSAFGQGSIAIKAAEQGTGLGLPIVQGLIALHGGEFLLESKLRDGTEAIAIFPASRVMEELPAIHNQDRPARGSRRPAAMAS